MKMTEALAGLEQRGLVVVEQLQHATLSELQQRLRQGEYHIFHFIGHGGFDKQADDGVLLLTDPEGRSRKVSAQFLGTLLHDHRPLRLAVLNACEGARASRRDPFAGTAQSLVQQGIPAVIAMQFEVTDDAAICFTREFYASIASGYPVDAALAESRKAIFAEVSEIEWGTPVLYMRAPDGRIFDIEQVSDADREQALIDAHLSAARTAAAAGNDAAEEEALGKVLAIKADHAAAAARRDELNRRRVEAADRAKRVDELRRDNAAHSAGSAGSASTARPSAAPAAPQVETGTSPRIRKPVKLLLIGAIAAVVLIVGAVAMTGLMAVVYDAGRSAASGSTAGSRANAASGSATGAVDPAVNVARNSTAPAMVTPQLRAQLVATINRGDAAEIFAYRTLNPSGLAAVYSREALATYGGEIANLARGGVYSVNQLHNQRFESFSVSPDGRRAEVRLTENWSTDFHSVITQRCVSHFHQHDVPQTAYLELTPQGWRIYAAKSDGPAPQLAMCH